jgi:DNA replication initiation complex subunit (GINS family)
MLLTFEKIREIQLNERSGELQKLPEGFFNDVAEYFKLKADSEEGKTAQKLMINLFERRLKKISGLASIYYNTAKVPDNMDDSEQKVYSEFISILKHSDSDFRKKLYHIKTSDSLQATHIGNESCPPEKASSPSQDTTSPFHETDEDLTETKPPEEKITVTFTMDTPELMTPEMETRSFKNGESAEISKTFAQFLEKRGFCKVS